MLTAAKVHDKHALPELLRGNAQGAHGASADASQKDLITSKAAKAKGFACRRTRYADLVDRAERARRRNESHIHSRIGHVFSALKRLWGIVNLRYRGLQKNAARASCIRTQGLATPARQ